MKSVIVFGGSGFIGREIALHFIKEGFRVVLTYRSHKPAEDSALSSALLLACDIGNCGEVASVFAQAKAAFGVPDAAINAAGIAPKQSLLSDISPKEIENVISVDLLGALYISREAARCMHENQAGSVIHISSMWGSIGASCEVPYSAAKGGMNAMVKALAKELAPDGIRVNAVAPGLLLSPMNAHLPKEAIETFKADTPLESLITPEDIIRAVDYLMNADHVTGQILAVDGGIVI